MRSSLRCTVTLSPPSVARDRCLGSRPRDAHEVPPLWEETTSEERGPRVGAHQPAPVRPRASDRRRVEERYAVLLSSKDGSQLSKRSLLDGRVLDGQSEVIPTPDHGIGRRRRDGGCAVERDPTFVPETLMSCRIMKRAVALGGRTAQSPSGTRSKSSRHESASGSTASLHVDSRRATTGNEPLGP